MLSADDDKPVMLSADDNKPVGKSGQRNRKTEQQSGKTGQRSRKSAQKQNPKPDQLEVAQEQVTEQVAEQLKEQVSAPFTASESYSTDNTLAHTDQAGSVASAEQLQDAEQQVSATLTSSVSNSIDSTHADACQIDSVASAQTVPVSFQSIAKAYEDYTRKSFEQARFLFEKLARVRSLDKALELQTDFVKHACETFIADSQKIRDLHRGLARQRLAYLEGVVAKMAPIALIPRAPSNASSR